MRAVARLRSLDGYWHVESSTGCGECRDIVSPTSLVKIDRKEMTGFICQQRINTNYASALQMIEDDSIGYRNKRLIGTFPALDPRLVADTAYPFVGACGGVSVFVRLRVMPALRKYIGSAYEQ
ncbi:MAG: hypothetical protein PF501_01035 [Salinisphaera sp.]|nr:hypothetical protein [Salinisphaera sp.]